MRRMPLLHAPRPRVGRLAVVAASAALLALSGRAALAQGAVPASALPSTAQSPAVPTGPLEVDRVVAVVGNMPILYSELMEEMLMRRARGVEIPEDSVALRKMEHEVLGEMVDAELLVQKARDEKVEVNEDQLNKQLDEQIRQIRSRFSSESEFRTELRRGGMGTPDEYRRKQLEMMRRNEMQRELLSKLRRDSKLVASPVTDQELDEAYQQSRATLPKREATIGFRQIVVSAKPSAAARKAARAKADSLLLEIAKGGDFELIARRESMDPGTKERGGDLGWNRRGKMVKEFDAMMFALPVGRVSPVIETAFGYHIIRVDRAQPSEVKARHILIRPSLDSNDVVRARLEADSVRLAIAAGANFDSLSAKHHDPVENGSLPEFPRKELPPAYATAISESASVGTVVGPFPIDDPVSRAQKYVVLRVTAAEREGEYSEGEVKARLREQVAEGKTIRKLIDTLKKQTFVETRI